MWRKSPTTWMNPENLSKFQGLRGEDVHDFVKKRFSAMKFQLLGNAALVDISIRCNLTGAVQPAALQEFIHRWKQYIETPACQKAREASKKKHPWQPQRFKRIQELHAKIERGMWINDWILEDWDNWYALTESDRHLCQDYCSYALHDELEAIEEFPKGIRFRGAASNIMSAGQPNCFNSIR